MCLLIEGSGDGASGCELTEVAGGCVLDADKSSNLPLDAIVFVLVAALLKIKYDNGLTQRPTCSRRQFLSSLDLGGSILLIASMCSLFLAMQWGGHRLSWKSLNIVALLTLTGVLLALFVLLEWKMGDQASVPFRILQQRSMASGAVYLFMFSMPNFAVCARILVRTEINIISMVSTYQCSSRQSKASVRRGAARKF
jgi:hypothetical protein